MSSGSLIARNAALKTDPLFDNWTVNNVFHRS